MNSALKRIKLLRENNRYTAQYIADYLGIDKNMYLQFEQGKCKKELSYFVLVKLSELYKVPIDYIIGTEEELQRLESPDIKNDIAEFARLLPEQRQLFLENIKNVRTISEEAFEKISENQSVTRYMYTDENGIKKGAVLWIGALKRGDACFVLAGSRVFFALLEGDDKGEYFQINGKKCYLNCGDLKILCTICARIDG